MKTTFPCLNSSKFAAFALLASSGVVAAAFAFPQDRGGPRFQDVLLHDRFDADGNGRLDRTERDLAREEAAARPAAATPRRPAGQAAAARKRRRDRRPAPKSLRIDP